MIGIFDSGDGGLAALYELRKRNPYTDVAFFADRSNAPYGTKTKKEITRLTARGIHKLLNAGADKVLIACCTASAVHASLPAILRERSLPIIKPTAEEASRNTINGRIGIISTKATADSRAFETALSCFDNVNAVFAKPMQELVYFVESGKRDCESEESFRRWLNTMLGDFKEKKIDTLILGCTHFGHLEREISFVLPGVKIINSAKEGALEIIKRTSPNGRGTTLYL
jgi:glutamate racemase